MGVASDNIYGYPSTYQQYSIPILYPRNYAQLSQICGGHPYMEITSIFCTIISLLATPRWCMNWILHRMIVQARPFLTFRFSSPRPSNTLRQIDIDISQISNINLANSVTSLRFSSYLAEQEETQFAPPLLTLAMCCLCLTMEVRQARSLGF